MPHLRQRIIESILRQNLSRIACVGLVGMRQVGKSTLLKKIAKRYISFDLPEAILEFERAGQNILDQNDYPLAVDEAQKYPILFDRLKYAIDQSGRSGRYLISGSVRFASRKQIRESLTGRILVQEMFPLTLAECHEKKASPFLTLVLRKNFMASMKKRAWATTTQIHHFLQCGGLPGICFKRDTTLRENLFVGHIDTLLSRDIFLVRQIKLNQTQLRTALTTIAQNQGLPTSFALLAHIIGCSQPTVKTLLEAFEGLFLIRKHGATYYIEDLGLSNHLVPVGKELSRFDMERAIYHELRVQMSLGLNIGAQLTDYKTRGGLNIPFFIKNRTGPHVAISVDVAPQPSDKNIKGMTWLQKRFRKQLVCIIFCNTDTPHLSSSGTMIMPWTWIF